MAQPAPSQQVTRIKAADAAAILERLSGSDRLERGSVFVLSVEAIRDRAPESWPRRREDVWEYVNRKLHEHLTYQDLFQKISDIDCLVAMTTEDGVAAQAVGLKILEEVLHHFLGRAERFDIRIKAVGKIDGLELSCVDLDPVAIARAREEQAAAPYRSQVSAELQRERTPVSFVARSGLRLRIDYALEHVVSLRHGVTAVLRVEPTVTFAATGELIPPRKYARLSDDDVALIDRSTLSFAALFTPEDARTQPPITVPVSFRTMASRRGRHSLSVIEGLTPERVRQGVLVELADVDRGTPTGRLVEITGLVGQLARGVLARAVPSRDALEPIRGVRLNGITMDFSELGLSGPQLEQLMRVMALQLRGKAPALIAQGLALPQHLPLADAAGFTHAAVRAAPMTADSREVA
jgi:hypothetical protein